MTDAAPGKGKGKLVASGIAALIFLVGGTLFMFHVAGPALSARRIASAETYEDQLRLVSSVERAEPVVQALVDQLAKDAPLPSSLSRRLAALTAIEEFERSRGVPSCEPAIRAQLSEALHADRRSSAYLLGYALYASYGRAEGLERALELIGDVDDVTVSGTLGLPPVNLARIEIQQLRQANRLVQEIRSRSAGAKFDPVQREWLR